MGRAEREQLTRTLNHHLNTVHETFQVLDQTAPSTLEKVSWAEVIKMGDQVYKQATIFICVHHSYLAMLIRNRVHSNCKSGKFVEGILI
ncbi:hypothetical protein DVH24_040391 [Malus domestica]|uniref:Uncharacterized protein n=1 Tax=Malus domestica TaxID=3750 RepID=A0A498IAK6_MALDO|nr:hypothetical protein DVH24_040391 [Malus domestica]